MYTEHRRRHTPLETRASSRHSANGERCGRGNSVFGLDWWATPARTFLLFGEAGEIRTPLSAHGLELCAIRKLRDYVAN